MRTPSFLNPFLNFLGVRVDDPGAGRPPYQPQGDDMGEDDPNAADYDAYDPNDPNAPYDPYEDAPVARPDYGMGETSYIRGGARPPQTPPPRQPQPTYADRPARDTLASRLIDRIRGIPREAAVERPYEDPQGREIEPNNVLQMPRPRREAERPPERQAAQTRQTAIYRMRDPAETERVIGYMMEGVSIILDLESLSEQQRVRVVSMVSGAAFVLGGTVEDISFHRTYFVAAAGALYGGEAEWAEEPARQERRAERPYAVR